jgi:DNA invertase Pin-like site-specific DNA recombinase
MIYGYIRVSTDRQQKNADKEDTAIRQKLSDELQKANNQRLEIETLCKDKNIVVGRWIEDAKLSALLKKMKKDDTLICSELSRLGRDPSEIMNLLSECMAKEVQVWTVKGNYRLGTDIHPKVLAFAFGLSAEIERTLLSQRVRESLARKRAEGVVLGRPKGAKNKKKKLDSEEANIKQLLDKKLSKSAIARITGVHRLTVAKFVKEMNSK